MTKENFDDTLVANSATVFAHAYAATLAVSAAEPGSRVSSGSYAMVDAQLAASKAACNAASDYLKWARRNRGA